MPRVCSGHTLSSTSTTALAVRRPSTGRPRLDTAQDWRLFVTWKSGPHEDVLKRVFQVEKKWQKCESSSHCTLSVSLVLTSLPCQSATSVTVRQLLDLHTLNMSGRSGLGRSTVLSVFFFFFFFFSHLDLIDSYSTFKWHQLHVEFSASLPLCAPGWVLFLYHYPKRLCGALYWHTYCNTM